MAKMFPGAIVANNAAQIVLALRELQDHGKR
jgi:hypothetical protein